MPARIASPTCHYEWPLDWPLWGNSAVYATVLASGSPANGKRLKPWMKSLRGGIRIKQTLAHLISIPLTLSSGCFRTSSIPTTTRTCTGVDGWLVLLAQRRSIAAADRCVACGSSRVFCGAGDTSSCEPSWVRFHPCTPLHRILAIRASLGSRLLKRIDSPAASKFGDLENPRAPVFSQVFESSAMRPSTTISSALRMCCGDQRDTTLVIVAPELRSISSLNGSTPANLGRRLTIRVMVWTPEWIRRFWTAITLVAS
jgi:hypothetical protein